MSGAPSRDVLCQRWIHVGEDDTPTEMVYRPAGYKLPPARGRTGFELRPDHTLSYLGIGPTDAPSGSAGRWEIEEGEPPAIRIELESGEIQRLPIVSAEPDRLVVRR